jgi:hypothetical protein
MRWLNGLMALLFIFAALVQYNDPDPVGWIGLYLAAAGACLWSWKRPGQVLVPAAVGGIALAWALTLVPGVVGKVPFLEMFSAWEMKNVGVEESREMYGLLIVVFWMLVLGVQGWRAARHRKPAPSGSV